MIDLTKLPLPEKIDIELLDAIRIGDIDCVRSKLRQGATPNFHSITDGATPLELAAGQGSLEIVRLIVESNKDALAFSGDRAMVAGVGYGQSDVVKYLISTGIDPNLYDENGNPILYFPVSKDDKELVEILLRGGADPNCGDKSGSSLFPMAVADSTTEIVKLFLDYGACSDKSSLRESGAILFSATGNPGTMKLFLDRGVPVNYISPRDGRTALIVAASIGCSECVELLVNAGSDPSLTPPCT